MSVTLLIGDSNWRKAKGLGARLKVAAARALKEAGRKGDLTVLLSGDAELKALNLLSAARTRRPTCCRFRAGESGALSRRCGAGLRGCRQGRQSGGQASRRSCRPSRRARRPASCRLRSHDGARGETMQALETPCWPISALPSPGESAGRVRSAQCRIGPWRTSGAIRQAHDRRRRPSALAAEAAVAAPARRRYRGHASARASKR